MPLFVATALSCHPTDITFLQETEIEAWKLAESKTQFLKKKDKEMKAMIDVVDGLVLMCSFTIPSDYSICKLQEILTMGRTV